MNPLSNEWLHKFYRAHTGRIWLAQAVALLLIGFTAAWVLPRSSSPVTTGEQTSHSEHAEAPQLWTCSMHPQIRRDGPGKCPLCGMQLIPVKASTSGIRTITISPAARKLMRVATHPVERRYVTTEVRMVGKVDYDETRLAHITAYVAGRLDRLYVDYTGVDVKKGDHLVYIYSEELYSAQEELIQALKNQRDTPPRTTRLIAPLNLVASSREKLRLLGLTATQVAAIEKRGTAAEHMTIYSPIGGIVIEKLRQEGDRVRTGDRVYTVADLNQVWVKLDAYESDLQWLRYGQAVEFTTEASPGKPFMGRIAFIDRTLGKETRTVKVRVNVPNTDGRLKPEMFVRAVVHSRVAAGGRVLDAALIGKWISPMHPEIVKDEPGNCDICGMPLVRAESLGYVTASPEDAAKPLVIPVSAALVTGRRAIVYVEIPTAEQPTYEGREIVLGPRAGAFYLVRRGLQEGELVVTHGNFKLDSALQISAKPSMMAPEGGGGAGHDHGGHGSAMTANGSGSGKPQMTLPPGFDSQLEQVVEAQHRVTAAIENADLIDIRTAFTTVGEATAAVDTKSLQGHPQMLWKEYAMLLGNDAVEGSEISTLRHADAVYLVLKRHVQRMRESFGLVDDDHEPGIVPFEVSSSFQMQLGKLWQVYQPLGAALAADDDATAKQAIEAIARTVGALDADVLEGDAAKVWMTEQANLSKIAADLASAQNIKDRRAAFALFSDEMISLIQAFGVGDAGTIFELHCPMAFGNRGGSWLQADDQTRNPYYGATMLKCADRVRQISPVTTGDPPSTTHDTHQH